MVSISLCKHRAKLTFILILTLLLTSSCALFQDKEQFDISYKNPDFTYEKLKDGQLIIGGVTSTTSKLTVNEQADLSKLVWRKLQRSDKDLTSYSTETFKKKVGEKLYANLIDTFQNRSNITDATNQLPVDNYSNPSEKKESYLLNAEQIKAIGLKVPEIRYAMFILITYDNLRSYFINDIEYEDGKSYQDMHNYHTRDITFYVQLYDLREHQLAWSWHRQTETTEKQEELDDKSFGDMLIGGLVTGILESATETTLEGMTDMPVSLDKLSSISTLTNFMTLVSRKLSKETKHTVN